MRAGTSALSPVPNSMFLEKTPENIYQVPLLFPFVFVLLVNCSDQKKSLKIRTKSSFLISLQNHKTQLSPVSPDLSFLSSPLANSSQPHTLAWSRLRPTSEVVWALLQGILWVFNWSDSSLQSGLLKCHLLKDTFCDHGRFVLQHWGPKPGFYT